MTDGILEQIPTFPQSPPMQNPSYRNRKMEEKTQCLGGYSIGTVGCKAACRTPYNHVTGPKSLVLSQICILK